MEIQSVSTSTQTSTAATSAENVKLEAGTSSLESALEMQKLVLKLIKSSGMNVDTRA